MNTEQIKKHWENIYDSTPVEETGWYEEHPTPSLELIEQCGLSSTDRILDVGSGASTLIDALAENDYKNILAVDISEKALSTLKDRLSKKGTEDRVELIVDNVAAPSRLQSLSPVTLWHDRALLHFLQTEEEKNQYARTLRSLVKAGGYAVIAEFSPDGVDKCSGLDVKKYDASHLSDLLGSDFELKRKFNYQYTTPSGGERPYIYTLFRRKQATV